MNERVPSRDRRRRAWWAYVEDEPIAQPSMTVHELEPEPPLLLDARGQPIARPRQKMGF